MTQKATFATVDIQQFISGLHAYIGQALKPIVQRLEALEKQPIDTLADCYRGAWLPGTYARGCLVTHSGSLWLAIDKADGKPGGSPNWRLVVKSGRDA